MPAGLTAGPPAGIAGWCARHYRGLLALLLGLGLVLRLYFAMNSVYIWDEHRDWIPEAMRISIDPAAPHLPIRTEKHNALVAYLFRAGSLIGDGSHLAWRWTSILAGVLTIAGTAALARRLAGPVAGLAAAALMALNEYHVTVSATAIQISWYMAFTVAMLILALDYLDRRGGWRLIAAGLFAGLSFLAYEIAALTVALVAVYMLARSGRGLLTRREFGVAAAIALILVIPDFYANIADGASREESYETFLGRISGFGVNPKYAALFFGDALARLYPVLLDRPFINIASEYLGYKGTNGLLGLALTGSVAFWLARLGLDRRALPAGTGLHLMVFAGVFGFFSVIETSGQYTLWVWAGVVVVPAAVLAGSLIATAPRPAAAVIAGLAGLGMLASLGDLARTNYGAPRMKGHALPAPLAGAPGSMVEVTVHFDICDLCGGDPGFALADVLYLPGDTVDRGFGPGARSVLGSDRVAGAEQGTDDRRLSLKIGDEPATGWVQGTYFIDYRAGPPGRGGETVRTGIVVEPDAGPPWPPAFWMPAE